MTKTVIGTISTLIIIVGTIYAISDRFVSRTEYTGSMQAIEKRLDRIEQKLDRVIETQGKR